MDSPPPLAHEIEDAMRASGLDGPTVRVTRLANFQANARTLSPPEGFVAELDVSSLLDHRVLFRVRPLCYVTLVQKFQPPVAAKRGGGNQRWRPSPALLRQVSNRLVRRVPDDSCSPPSLDAPVESPWGAWLGPGGRVGLLRHDHGVQSDYFVLVQAGADRALQQEFLDRLKSWSQRLAPVPADDGDWSLPVNALAERLQHMGAPTTKRSNSTKIGADVLQLMSKLEEFCVVNARRLAQEFVAAFSPSTSETVAALEDSGDHELDKAMAWFFSSASPDETVPLGYKLPTRDVRGLDPIPPGLYGYPLFERAPVSRRGESRFDGGGGGVPGVSNTLKCSDGGSRTFFYSQAQPYNGSQSLAVFPGGNIVWLGFSNTPQVLFPETKGAVPTHVPFGGEEEGGEGAEGEDEEEEEEGDTHIWRDLGLESVREVVSPRNGQAQDRILDMLKSKLDDLRETSVVLMLHASRARDGRVSLGPADPEDQVLGDFEPDYEAP